MRLRLIVDTNIIIAALIKDSITRKLLFHQDMVIFIIDYSFDELKKYEHLIIEKSRKDRGAVEFVLRDILSKAIIIESASIKSNFPKAS